MVEPDNYEAIYSNTPSFGPSKATERVRAVGARKTARWRLVRGETSPQFHPPNRVGLAYVSAGNILQRYQVAVRVAGAEGR
jgi:hypothetical protein